MPMNSRMAVASLIALLAAGACVHGVPDRRIVPPPDAATRAVLDARVRELMRSVPVDTYEPGTFTAAGGTTIPYRLLRPAELAAGRKAPLVVLFHGSGAIGTDNLAQVGQLAKRWATPEMRGRYPAFVVVPQFPSRSAVYRDGRSSATDSLHAGLALIDELLRTLPVDRQRVYAIGFSMGGSAVWNAVALRPELFSAAVAVAGVPNPDALRRGRTRLLLIHGDADEENPFSATSRVYAEARSPWLELWQYRGLGHEFPAQLLDDTRIAEWLFGA
jgi:predicted peptidase